MLMLDIKNVESWDTLFVLRKIWVSKSHLISGDTRSLSPERAHHMLLTASCSSHVDISPAGGAWQSYLHENNKTKYLHQPACPVCHDYKYMSPQLPFKSSPIMKWLYPGLIETFYHPCLYNENQEENNITNMAVAWFWTDDINISHF